MVLVAKLSITDEAVKRNLAANLTRLIKSRGVSLRDVAEVVGCSHTAVSQYANGEKLASAAALARLAHYFETSADELLERRGRGR